MIAKTYFCFNMEPIKKQDFVEIEYTGKLKEENIIFDTTDEKVAKENKLHGHDYGPIIICVGEEQLLKGIDKNIEGKEIGKEYDIDVNPDNQSNTLSFLNESFNQLRNVLGYDGLVMCEVTGLAHLKNVQQGNEILFFELFF